MSEDGLTFVVTGGGPHPAPHPGHRASGRERGPPDVVLLEAVREVLSMRPEPERGQFRLLHVSTDEVYGSAPEGSILTEESRYAPSSPYAASKASADQKLIPHMILSASEGRELPMHGDGRQVRDCTAPVTGGA